MLGSPSQRNQLLFSIQPFEYQGILYEYPVDFVDVLNSRNEVFFADSLGNLCLWAKHSSYIGARQFLIDTLLRLKMFYRDYDGFRQNIVLNLLQQNQIPIPDVGSSNLPAPLAEIAPVEQTSVQQASPAPIHTPTERRLGHRLGVRLQKLLQEKEDFCRGEDYSDRSARRTRRNRGEKQRY